MSMVLFGTVVTAPSGDGLGVVQFADASRLVYFNPARFIAPWAVPAPSDYVSVAPGVPFWTALSVIKLGAPTYTYTGGD